MKNNYPLFARLFTVLLCFSANRINAQPQTPTPQTLTGATTITCPLDNTLTLQNSEMGFNYFLRNAVDTIIGSSQTGTETVLNFQTGEVSATTDFHVFAANPSYALDFDGTDDYVLIPHSSSLDFTVTDSITLEAWIKPTDLSTNGGFQHIFRKDNGGGGRIILSFQENDILSFGLETAIGGYQELDVTIDPAEYEDQWVHILATYDGAHMKLYKDGTTIGAPLAKTGEIVAGFINTSATIGAFSTDEINFVQEFNGKIASLRVWNKALTTPQEIQQARDNLFVGDETGLVAYYPFFENAGTQLTDVSSNINNGSINGATWSTGTTGGVGEIVSNVQTIAYDDAPSIVYVDVNATGTNCGDSWANAKASIQEAADAVAPNGEILIAAGTYKQGAVITINKSLTIKGGYPAGGGMQDIDNNPTIIDGENAYGVFEINSDAYLEGIQIQNGATNIGAGIFFTSSFLTLKKVIVKNNTATSINSFPRGGGILGFGAVQLEDCEVSQNSVNLIPSESPTLARSYGGGIHASSVTLINSTILSNRVSVYYNSDSEAKGGGVYCSGTFNSINSVIKNNLALSEGSPASTEGGGVYAATINAVNTQISGNVASGGNESKGGGVYVSSSSVFTNCQIDNNYSLSDISFQAGGVYGNTTLQNSILWNNFKALRAENSSSLTANEHESGSFTVNHSLVKGQNPAGTLNLDGTLVTDTFFVNNSNTNFNLNASSLLLNAGNNSYLPLDTYDIDNDADSTEILPLDFNNRDRIKNVTIDIGLYEEDFSNKQYNTNATDYYFDNSSTAAIQDGLTWATAFSSLDDLSKIQDQTNIQNIYLASGEFKINNSLSFSTVATINGAFDAITNSINPNEETTIDAQFKDRVILTTQEITLQNVVLKNGTINDYHQARGGGISGTVVNLNNSKVINCSAVSSSYGSGAFGGGIDGTTITVVNSELIDNFTNAVTGAQNSRGGGIYGAVITVTNSLIHCNSSSSEGSSVSSEGGGILGTTSILLKNTLVADNKVLAFSPGFDAFPSGGGLHGIFTLENSILFGNTFERVAQDGTTNGASEYDATSVTINYSLVKDQNPMGMSNIDATVIGFDPLFVDEANGDYRLQLGSPLINAGLDSYNTTTFDLDGNSRFEGLIDIGPYELVQNLNRWNGTSWSFGTPPVSTDSVSIEGNYHTALNGSFMATSLIVTAEDTLFVDAPGTHVSGDEQLLNNGVVYVQSGASLITRGTVSNGNYFFERETTFDDNTGRYSVLGSPISSGQTDGLGSLVYEYDESIPYESGVNDGLNRYLSITSNETMVPGKGYFSAYTGTAQFAGTPNFGNVTIPVTRTDHSMIVGDANEDVYEGFNLLANPYPTAISLSSFLNGNPSIEGTIWIWDDGGSDTERRANGDFLAINTLGVSAGGSTRAADWNGHIGAMQGFFVRAITDASIGFADSMKVVGMNEDSNFFRFAKHDRRTLKLSLTDENNFYETLIGFTDEATSTFDSDFDAPLINTTAAHQIYSLLEDQRYAIQAGSLENQSMNIGIKIAERGKYNLNLKETSLPESDDIWLTDHLIGKTHNLAKSSYEFTSKKGEFSHRFRVDLGSIPNAYESNPGTNALDQLTIYGEDGQLILTSETLKNLDEVTVYDLSGKVLKDSRHVVFQNNTWTTALIKKGIVLVKVKSNEGIKFKKLAF